ncbi:transposase [soil metagenome]
MPRFARVVVPGVPHHVTQRGNRREPIFFEDGDHAVYCALLAEQMRKHDVEVWAYCLMPNHVHLILTPAHEAGLGRALGEAHRRYASFINARSRWVGHLFQNRFSSAPMDEGHLISAVRYVSLNPVRAGLAARAEAWPWSSVRAHLEGKDDGLVRVAPVLERISRFSDLIEDSAVAEGRHEPAFRAIRLAEALGRPLGTRDFVDDLERRLGRPLARRAPGPKPKPKLAVEGGPGLELG